MSAIRPVSTQRRDGSRLVGLLGLAVLAVTALMGYLIWSGYQEAVRGAEITTRNYAAILEARLDATLRRADAILLERVRTIPAAALSKRAVPRYAGEIDAMLDSHMARFDELAGLRIFDVDGDRLYTSGRAITPLSNVADLDYFHRLRDDPQASLVFSEVAASRATGRMSMAVARALRDDRGAFRGVVAAAIEIDYFKALFQALEIGPQGFVSLMRSDNFRTVLRHPMPSGWFNRVLPAGTAVREALSAGNKRATLEFTSARTGVDVIGSYRALESYPFLVVAAVGREDVLAGWRTRTQVVGVAGLLLLGLLVGLMIRHRGAEAREARVTAGLVESEERFRTLFEQAAVGVTLTESATGRFVRVNRKFADFLGYSHAEMLQQTLRSITHPDDLTLNVAYRERLRAGELPEFSMEKRYIRKDGSVVWGLVTVSPIRKPDGSFEHQVAVVTDIDQRRRAQEALHDSEARYRRLTELSSDWYWEEDANYRCTETSVSALKQLGLDAAKRIGKTRWEIPSVGVSEAHWAAHRADLDARRTFRGFELGRINRRGELVWGSISGAPIFDAQGNFRGYGGVGTDITERKRQEAELIAARQAAENASLAKTRFLAAASHDLRQPIQAINLFLEALNRSSLSEGQKEISAYLSLAVHSLGELLGGLLDISKLDAGIVAPHLAPTNTEAVLRRIEAEFAPVVPENNLHFRLVPRRQDLALRTDPDLLLRILRNIVGNAVKYTEHGGILVGARRRGDRGVIQVWDTGPGIASQHLSHIFEEYFQIGNPQRDKTKGLGLGLAIVRRLAKLIGAEVHCRSRLGRGTVFEISLPLATEPSNGSPYPHVALDPEDASGFTGRRIVVIEDDVLVAKAIEQSLGALGMTVTAFNDAQDALGSLEIADADFYISDFRLPGGIDGVQLLDAIQRRSARPISAVLLTGDTSPNQIDLSTASNWNVLFKPVDLSKLLSVMIETAGESRRPENRKHRV